MSHPRTHSWLWEEHRWSNGSGASWAARQEGRLRSSRSASEGHGPREGLPRSKGRTSWAKKWVTQHWFTIQRIKNTSQEQSTGRSSQWLTQWRTLTNTIFARDQGEHISGQVLLRAGTSDLSGTQTNIYPCGPSVRDRNPELSMRKHPSTPSWGTFPQTPDCSSLLKGIKTTGKLRRWELRGTSREVAIKDSEKEQPDTPQSDGKQERVRQSRREPTKTNHSHTEMWKGHDGPDNKASEW